MARSNRPNARKAKVKSNRRRTKPKNEKPAAPAGKGATEASRQLDKVVRQFDGAAENLQNTLEQMRGVLPEIVALEANRDRLRRIRTLADDGILDSLQRLALALEELGPCGLPKSLVPHYRSARMALDHLCRAFEFQPVYQPGDSLTIKEEQLRDFDWSSDYFDQLTFPAAVVIQRSGWQNRDNVFVQPSVVRRSPVAASD